MSTPGSLVEVLVQTRGSQVVGDHIATDTTILVGDSMPFGDDTDSGQVLIDGTAYTYTSVTETPDAQDPSAVNGILTLTAGLAGAVTDTTPVEVWNGQQVLDDLVLMVSVGEEADPPVPVTLTATQRAFWEGQLGPVEPPVAVLLSDDLTALEDAPGWTPSINGAALVGQLPDPAEIAVDPPTESPAIYSVTGSADALTVYVEPILPTTLLDYYVNGVLVLSDQRATIVNITSDGTNPLAVDTSYTITVQAHNAATDADPAMLPPISAGVTGQLDPGMTTTQVVAILAAGTIITGALQFGSNGVLDSTGLTITQLDGRQTYMHADGSGNQFVGQAILDTATILLGISIAGTSVLSGFLTITSGVTDPGNKVGVTSAGWDYVDNSGNDYGYNPRGLFDNGTYWVYTDTGFGVGNVNAIDKTTGARTVLLSLLPSGFIGNGGVVKVGTNWYVLGRDGSRSGNWYVKVFNSSWVENTGAEFAPLAAPDDSLTIGIDGAGGLLIAKRTVASNLFINPYTTAGVSSGSSSYPTWPNASLTGIVKAAVDTASVRYVVSSANGGTRVYATSGARVASEEWPNAFGQLPLGISYDGSNWHTLHMAQVATYTNLIGSYDFAYDWGDNDTAGSSGAGTGLTGANTARTRPSPLRTVVLAATGGGLPKRSKITMSLPSAPQDDGTTDGSNTANLYAAATGNTLVLQTSLPTSPAVGGTITALSATYSTLATSGTAPSSTNGFAGRLGAVGQLLAAGPDAGGSPLFSLPGSGGGNVGPYAYDANGVAVGVGAMQVDQPSGDASPTSTTNVTVPGLSLSVTSPHTSAVWEVTIEADVRVTTGGTTNIVELLLDGASASSLFLVTEAPTAGTRVPGSKTWRITGLSAGSHTFTARTRNTASSSGATVFAVHTQMSVTRTS